MPEEIALKTNDSSAFGYFTGRHLFFYSFPLMILASTASIILVVDAFFISHVFSIENGFNAQQYGYALVAMFQVASIRMASEAQVFISQACGMDRERDVGVYLWQMIWLSLLSMIVTVPLGYIAAELYFDGAESQGDARGYYWVLMSGNFLFPLGVALTTFFSGRGKRGVLIAGTIGVLFFHFFSSWIFIKWYALKGAAISILLTQLLYCLFLFGLVLRPKYRKKYGTDQWHFRLTPFLATVRVGLFNGLSAALISFGWVVIMKIVAVAGSDYLTIVALGDNLAHLLAFFNLGVGQAISIIVSGMIGRNEVHKIPSVVYSASKVFTLILVVLFPLLVLFPGYVVGFYFPNYQEQFSPEMIKMLEISCQLAWFFVFVTAVDRIVRAILTAFGSTVYMFAWYMLSMSIGTCVPIYFAFCYWELPASYFWLVNSLTIFARNIPLYFRIKKHLEEKELSLIVH